MIPYATFLYFGLLLYILLATVLIRASRPDWTRWWILIATLAVLPFHFGTGVFEVLGYAVGEWMVARVFLHLRSRQRTRRAFYSAVALALLPLVLAKFLPLLAAGSTLAFIGISYVTFRSLDVIFNIEDGVVKDLPPARYVAYLLFFPTISAGPIDRYRRFGEDWNAPRSRAQFLTDFDLAIHRVFEGFLYKFIIAHLIQKHWLAPIGKDTGVLADASYMYGYSFYLFFDFAGYSAFAIGVSYLLGIRIPENFRYPFLAPNIREFWNRWHISLSTWFRDHVYMRFVFAATKGHWFKGKHTASHLGFLLTFLIMGLWHGTAWHYIAYGLYHAVLLISYDIFARWNKTRHVLGKGPLAHAAAVFLTFNFICFGLLIFSGRFAR